MSNIGMKYQLEARVNIAGENSPCAICGRCTGRIPGSTETYLAGSHNWVCAGCAECIDHDLAVFAYRPNMLPRQRPAARRPEYCDDGCSACGRISGKYLNLVKDHWKYCERHGLRWHIGYNLFSSWQCETEDDWARNEEVLIRCREIELYFPRLPLRTRAQRRLQNLIWRMNRLAIRLGIAEEEECPF
jgi:hypothetical protein